MKLEEPNKHKCPETEKAQNELANIYLKEQTEYIQNQIDKIRDSVEDRQCRIAWQAINEVSRSNTTAEAKLKATNQKERINLRKQYFENLLGIPPKFTHEPITRIISKQLDIKLGPIKLKELDSVLRKIKNRKVTGLEEIPPEVWKTRQFNDILLRHSNAVYNQNPMYNTSIAAKIYNALLRNRIGNLKIDNIHRKNQKGFRRNRSKTSQIMTIGRILEGVQAKNLQARISFVDFTNAFDSIDGANSTRIWPTKRNCLRQNDSL